MKSTKFPSIQPQNSQGTDLGNIQPRNIRAGTAGNSAGIQYGGVNGVTISGTDGIYAGASDPATAPFHVELSGKTTATNVTVQTASSGARVVINPSSGGAGFPGAEIDFYDSSGALVAAIFANGNSVFLQDTQGDYYKINENAQILEMLGNNGVVISAGNTNSIQMTPTQTGFFNSIGSTQPTITGSRAGNDALASLITGIASLGLVIDATTV